MKQHIVMLVLVGLSTLAYGQHEYGTFISGDILYSWCQKEDNLCTGYILGTVDTSRENHSETGHDLNICVPNEAELCVANEAKLCVPSEAVPAEIQQEVVRYLLENPDKRHKPAPELVMSVLYTTYACEPPAVTQGTQPL